MKSPDVVIAGAGLIGMACALECSRRGVRPLLVERDQPGREASWAAAGMLAAHDLANPPELRPLAERSIALFPSFLERLREQSGSPVPIETEWTLEQGGGERAEVAPIGFDSHGYRAIPEQSLDPRKLSAALHSAILAAGIPVQTLTRVVGRREEHHGVIVETASGTGYDTLHTGAFLDCTGAWSMTPVSPAKGQMLRVHAPGALSAGSPGNVVIRNESIYLVPRLDGSVVIGATVEDAGFDKTVHPESIALLRRRAASLLPGLQAAPELESWAGLRPDTPDHLPLLGATGSRTFVAAGHFRNGVLLAPATAEVMTQALLGETPSVALAPFAPHRFAHGQDRSGARTIFAQTA